MQKLNSSLDYLEKGLKIYKYDEEKFKFNKMLDEYKVKLNNFDDKLGKISYDFKNNKLVSKNVFESIKDYYKDNFDVELLKNKNSKKMDSIVEKYLEGILWVFEEYYNNFNISANRDTANKWFYPYSNSPLLTQIYYYLDKRNNFKNIYLNLQKYILDRKEFFNSLESLVYVSSKNVLKELVPKEYIKFLNNKNYFPDLDKISDEIWNSEISDQIYCSEPYLNKCNLIILKKLKFDDKQFLKDIRKIKLGTVDSERKGSSTGIDNRFIFNYKFEKISISQVRQKFLNTKKYKYHKDNYKDKGLLSDKIKYKFYKKKIKIKNKLIFLNNNLF